MDFVKAATPSTGGTVSDVTIGFVPRDRFSIAARSLRSIYDRTHRPFQMIIVDCGIPDRYWREMEAVLRGRRNYEVVRVDRFLQTNEAHNLVIERNRSPFLCLIENDNLVHENWLQYLIAACEEHPADVAVPLIFERDDGKVHFDDRLGSVRRLDARDGASVRIVPRGASAESDRMAVRRPTELIETHCMLFRSEVFERIGGLDEAVEQSRQEVDLSMALYHAGARCVLEPRARTTFSPPPPINPDERDFYLFKWDVGRSMTSHEHIKRKWGLLEVPTSIPFVQARRDLAKELDPAVQVRIEEDYRAGLAKATEELAEAIPAGEKFILVDDVMWDANEVAAGRTTIPFLERDGEYWGRPAHDAEALEELERLRGVGARFIAFAAPAFWWLSHYQAFHRDLRDRFPCILETERLVIFDLREGGYGAAASENPL
jgi:hypothetical protein